MAVPGWVGGLAATGFAVLTAWPVGVTAAPRAADLVRAELVAEPRAAVPGEPFSVGLRLTMKPGWHTYWRNPGDSGLPTEIRWRLPPGWQAGPVTWPTPERLPVSHLVNYGYEGEVVLLSRLTPPRDAPGGRATLAADVSYLVCEQECIPGEAGVRLDLAVTADGKGGGADLGTRDLFEAARGRLPVPSPWPATVETTADGPVLRVAAPGLRADLIRSAYFFPYAESAIEHAAPQPLTIDPGGLRLALKAGSYGPPGGPTADGVLVVEETLDGGTTRGAFALGTEPAMAASPLAAVAGTAGPVAAGWTELAVAALLALAGGLVLNVMPCVFPVLSIKVMSLVRHAGLPPAQVRLHGLAYAGGVVGSFVALAGLLLALRAAGAEIGWGFQLQSPGVVAALAFLMLALGLSLSGVAEFGTRLAAVAGRADGEGGLAGSALTGVLAAVVATPCTAPFMAAATGYALTAPAPAALAVFAALGVGMALPFLVLTVAPGLVGRLPRPGRWMVLLRQALAFPLYATAAWLVFVLSRQVGPAGLMAALLGLVVTGFSMWALRTGAGASGWGRRLARGAALGSLATLVAVAVVAEGDRAANFAAVPAGVDIATIGEEPFTQARLDALRAGGRPVFVNLTAAWCITCAVNDRLALSSDAVRAAMADRSVTYLRGDWTNRNPEITSLLERNGRSGVPLYLVYAGTGEPTILPQLLTEGIVLDALEALPKGPERRASLGPGR